ncbi:mitochondrial carnitine/acylcarnitine carrier protein [Euwallacea fornicatus]|uniref:mitochondrial carnitine/acylcarnitine carrier protein n=1 Tax=Euwallacea fornicatus TaxID=995702 RepID=UPI00338E87AC
MSEMGPLEYLICGGFGGISTILVGHPLDTIKVRLQTMPLPKSGELSQYAGTLDCLKKTVKYEGPLGLYRGMGAPLLGVSPIFALSFMGFGVGKKLFCPEDIRQHTHSQYFVAGAFSGIFTTFIMTPGERIKCLLQIQGAGGGKPYSGPIDVFMMLYRQGGVAALYKGMGATLLRDVPASGVYFLTYEAVQNYITRHGEHEASILGTIISGGIAGVANWLVGMPSDVLKSRFQTAPEGRYPHGLRDVLKELIANEGPLALYKGIVPVLLRAFPANAACFLGFELGKKLLNLRREPSELKQGT